MSTTSAAPRLELCGITKRFPGTLANDAVDLVVQPGEIHALLGENGAGKSTLVKILYGLLQADAGCIRWQGEAVRIANPKAARDLGIAMVFQHFSLFEAMTVVENVALGLPPGEPLDDLAGRIERVARTYGLPLDPHRPVHRLSVGERQRIEIVRALLQQPKLLVMDEPTSVLTPQEVERLFQALRQLHAEGLSILYISHKLDEIRALCETATILRRGRVVARLDPRTETAASLGAAMVGRDIRPPRHRESARTGLIRLAVEGLDRPASEPGESPLQGIGFAVAGGEILGIAGVAGNGQGELLAALGGEVASPAQTIRLDGQGIGQLDVRARRARGLVYVPEERLGHGSVGDLSLTDNTLLSGLRAQALRALGFLDRRVARRYAEDVVRRFAVATTGPMAAARSLSGGNLQKFLIGRELMQAPKVVVCGQPTWGVDAGAAAAIHQALFDLADQGAALVVVSQDLDELFLIADRIAVLNGGRLSAPRPVADLDPETVGLLMGGVHGEDDDAPARAA
ncbi:MAG: ABC transporter ATP-binding protein [Geminicoccaceae bacterium]|nr:MAG: ABC transporter ATP-binding protein [Geminicoccaceae bacterium]